MSLTTMFGILYYWRIPKHFWTFSYTTPKDRMHLLITVDIQIVEFHFSKMPVIVFMQKRKITNAKMLLCCTGTHHMHSILFLLWIAFIWIFNWTNSFIELWTRFSICCWMQECLDSKNNIWKCGIVFPFNICALQILN